MGMIAPPQEEVEEIPPLTDDEIEAILSATAGFGEG